MSYCGADENYIESFNLYGSYNMIIYLQYYNYIVQSRWFNKSFISILNWDLETIIINNDYIIMLKIVFKER